jgi:RHH-type proline utilization regulon transcriptional repressor/proline dehydrogenase/delta 1-pyrroline-5-carboxylate dehydrogenase
MNSPSLEPSPLPIPTTPAADPTLEAAAREWGETLFRFLDSATPPSLFTTKGLYGSLMDWAMKDELFKVQMFRFVDVLPTLASSSEIARHLSEYLDNGEVRLSPALRAGLKAATFASGLVGGGIRAQVAQMARLFMLGDDPREIAGILKTLRDSQTGFTVDVLGEAVVSETEADAYAARYLELLGHLARETAAWGSPSDFESTPHGPVPRLNISLKLSAFYSQIHPADPDTALDRISNRLRPILIRARDLGAAVCIDMESYVLKDLTLKLFRTLFAEPTFHDGPDCGIALQTYLRDANRDLHDLIDWARNQHRRITVRLVKGAYWDYESIVARQRGWPVPVFEHKAETDANFERLSTVLLENNSHVAAAFASHNLRSLAHVLAQANRLGLDRRAFEFQVLYGMADPIKAALLEAGCRVRAYCPVGQLLPGMAYLVRRLLENTSNEGFLAQKFAQGASRDALLRNPTDLARTVATRPSPAPPPPTTPTAPGFQNEPSTDFTRSAERDTLRAALAHLRTTLGRSYPLIIGGRRVDTPDWAPSLNPADQREVIGRSARATIAHADNAVTAARSAWQAWARTPAVDRADRLDSLGAILRRDKAHLTALLILEAGKNWTEADADVAEAIDFCHFNAAVMRDLGRPRPTQILAGETNTQHWWPRGTGVIIAPWNFPLAILTGMTSAAVVAGNTVVLKPSDQTPVIAATLMDRIAEAGFPPGVVNLITGRGSVVGAHLGAHPNIDFIAFTGSVETGLALWETAGRTPPEQTHVKKVVCEMGGKNPLIVDADADLDEAVAAIIQSAFGYNGQKCSALSRLIVLDTAHDRLLERLIAAASSLRIGPAEIPGNVLGPVIDRTAQQHILEAIDTGKREATLAWQGTTPDPTNACYVPPTLFTNVPPSSTLFRQEIFGPILAMTRASSFDHALDLANDSSFALTAGLFSRSPVHIERAKTELVCGNLYINRTITGAIVGRQPFGGFRLSGGGTKAGGAEYLQHFLVPRVITENCLRRGFAPALESEPRPKSQRDHPGA